MAVNVAGDGAWTVQSTDTARVGRAHDNISLIKGASLDPSTARSGVFATVSDSANSWQDLLVVKTAAVGTLSCTVAAGGGVINRSGQGPVEIMNNASKTVTLTTASGANPRIDRISARHYDTALGDSLAGTTLSGAGGWQLEVTDGTPAGSPVAPALPANSIPLATVLVPTSAANSALLTVTDVRQGVGVFGATRPLLPGDTGFTGINATSPTAFAIGERIENTLGEYRWNGTSWQPVINFNANTYTPTFVMQTATGTSAGYIRFAGNWVFITGVFTATAGVSLGTGTITMSVPYTSANITGANWTGATVWAGGNGYTTPCILGANSTTVTIYAADPTSLSTVASGKLGTPGTAGIAFAAGHTLSVNIQYPLA